MSMVSKQSAVADKRVEDRSSLTFVSGMEALLHGILALRARDGERHKVFISGYRGSPLGGFDSMLFGRRAQLDEQGIAFKPGLNEDLAVTACWGTQQTALMSEPRQDGVTAFWYGKGPGVDRSGDAIKHGNFAGVHPNGGVVLLVGDDHGAKSSTVAHQSDHALAAAGVPIIYPANLQEYRDCVPLAAAMSRFASVWVALKCVTETIEGNGVIDTAAPLPDPTEPDVERPAGGYHIGQGHVPVQQEHSLFTYRLPAAKRFAEANGCYRTEMDAVTRSLGIVAPGKTYVDTVEALRLLGIDRAAAKAMGLRLLRPLLVWPMSEAPVVNFVRNHREILVIEEKRPFIEEQIGGMLLRMGDDERPRLSGKLTPDGAPLLSDHGELDPTSIARAIGARLESLGLADAALTDRLRSLETAKSFGYPAAPARMPAFCSGCPHNRSTKLPDGSMAFGGIGCHGMALFVPELRTPSATHMGGEGTNWIGLADYVGDAHVFQNMGEGTYAHSGSLAIRAAVAANANVTYKILHNGATAMTGGQPVEGGFSAGQIAAQLLAEGVRKVVVLNTEGTRSADVPSQVPVHARTDLEVVQRNLREIEGVTALIYEQGCATEKRRLRKRGLAPDPNMRTYIHPDVCEGCGDCSRKSNCVSILPLETEQGRKRVIDQESCNKDYTCTEGFCPSFITITGGEPRASELRPDLVEQMAQVLTDPVRAHHDGPFNIVFAGIGGSGVITLGRSVAEAARADGGRVSAFDVTGLAQKNGPVYSHVRLFPGNDREEYQARVPAGQLDLLIGCDIVAAATPSVTGLLSPERTQAFISESLVPTATFQTHPDQQLELAPYVDLLARALPHDRLHLVHAPDAVTEIIGRGVHHNIVLLGYAYQKGAVPASAEELEQALGNKGKSGTKNLFAFRAGRLLAQDPAKLGELLHVAVPVSPVPLKELPYEALVARCSDLLQQYQDARYAERYRSFVDQAKSSDPDGRFAHAVALGLFQLMRYKDEYEVARLMSDQARIEELRAQFSGELTLSYNLAPPMFSWRKTANGEPRKIRFGPWMGSAFKVLARLKFLRGTPFDPFGYLADRRLERKLIADYRARVSDLAHRLPAVDYDTAVAIASLPRMARGYGLVKDRNVAAMEREYDRLAGKLTR